MRGAAHWSERRIAREQFPYRHHPDAVIQFPFLVPSDHDLAGDAELLPWACGNVATVHVFGGHYYIKKRESGYDWRWADADTFKEMATPLKLNHITSLSEL